MTSHYKGGVVIKTLEKGQLHTISLVSNPSLGPHKKVNAFCIDLTHNYMIVQLQVSWHR